MCKMSRERVSGVGGEKLRGMVVGDIVILCLLRYIFISCCKKYLNKIYIYILRIKNEKTKSLNLF